MQKERIGVFQLFSLLFLCRMFTTVTFSPLLGDSNINGDFLVNIFFAGIFILLLCIPSALFYKKFAVFSPTDFIKEKSKPFFIFCVLFYSAFFIFFAAVSVSRFFVFLSSVIYPEKNLTLFLLVAVITCAYASYLGIEALSRANVILLFITFIGVFSILCAVGKKVSIYNLEPILYYPLTDAVKSGLFAAGRTAEAVAFPYLAKKTEGNIKRGFAITFLLFILSLVVLFFFLNSVSGEFAKTQLFPFYSLAIIARFPYFERLDAVVTAIWIFSILIKCSLFIYIPSSLLKDGFSLGKKPSIIICFVIVSILSLVFSINLNIQNSVSSPYFFLAVTVSSAVIIPSVCLALKRRKSEI